MRLVKTVSTFIILLIFAYLFTCPALSAEKTKISIQRFDVAKNLDPALGGFLYEVLLERIVDSGKYIVVDWEELGRIQKYIADSQPNVSEKDAREQAGNQLGIEMIYVGSLKEVGSKYFISVKVLKLDLSVVDTENKFVKTEDDLWDGINEIADNLLGVVKVSEKQPTAGQVRKGRFFETEHKYVTDDIQISMRTGPSSKKKVMALIKSGAEITILRSSGKWTKVRQSNGKEGWLLSRYLIKIPTNNMKKSAYITDDIKIAMRTAPGLQGKIITLLKSRDELEVLESSEDWTRVRQASGREGWVLTTYLIEHPDNRWCVKGDCLNGNGTYLYLSGKKYKGQFMNGRKHGKGIMIWKNGIKYVGKFQNDRVHGQGDIIYPNGSVEHRLYENGNLIKLMEK
jgi:uncharacterized protein YgiM (DUF1202 family)